MHVFAGVVGRFAGMSLTSLIWVIKKCLSERHIHVPVGDSGLHLVLTDPSPSRGFWLAINDPSGIPPDPNVGPIISGLNRSPTSRK